MVKHERAMVRSAPLWAAVIGALSLAACAGQQVAGAVDGRSADSDGGEADSAADVAGDGASDGSAGADMLGTVISFSLPDVNPTSATFGQTIAPADFAGEISGYYFVHAT